MRSLVAAVLVALATTSLTTVPAASAVAEVTVTAEATPRTLGEGDATVVAGAARGAAPGSRVVLQRRVTEGWRSLREARTDADHTYAFSVTPPRGHPVYRVVFPRQAGLAFSASDPVRLSVQWRPTLTLEVEWRNTAAGGRWLIASGTTSYDGAGRVLLQQKYDGQDWSNAGFLTLDGGTFRGTPPKPVRPGNPLRAVLGASGVRLRAESAQVVVPSPDPYHLALDDPAGLTLPYRQTLTTVLIDAQSGDLVTLGFDGWVTEWPTVVGPDGATVPVSSAPARFQATQTGTYAVTFWVWGVNDGPTTVWAYTPKEYAGEWGVPVDVAPDFPHQPIDVVYPGAAGQVFTTPAVGYVPEVRDSSGPLSPWQTIGTTPVYRLASDGPVTYRIIDGKSTQVSLGRTIDVTATIDGPRVPVELGSGTSLVVVSVDVPAGAPFLVDANNLAGASGRLLVGPDDLPADLHQADPAPGTYRLLVLGNLCPTCSTQVTSPLLVDTPVDGPPVAASAQTYRTRWIWQRFTAQAGDVVTTSIDYDTGFSGPARLIGPGGQEAVPEGRAWRIPASGVWQLRFDTYSWAGHLAARSVAVSALSADGSPATVTIGQPEDVQLVHVDAPVGVVARVTLDQIDATLGSDWEVEVYAPDGHWYNSFSSPGELPPFAVTRTGGLDLVVSVQPGSSATGSLRLAVTTQ